jgi:hypothetical protein
MRSAVEWVGNKCVGQPKSGRIDIPRRMEVTDTVMAARIAIMPVFLGCENKLMLDECRCREKHTTACQCLDGT